MRKLLAQFARFGIVGALAFAIDFGVLVLLTELLSLDPVVSATVSFTVSVVFNYLASMRFVFTRRDDLSRSREFVIFIVLSVLGLIINDLIMWAGTAFSDIDYRIIKILATAVVMIWNFVSRKLLLESH